MASDAKTDVTEMIRRTQGMVASVPAMTPQMEAFWKAQDGILDDVEDYTRAWFERRHAATRSALEAVREVSGNGSDPATAMTVIADWQRHSMERMTEDIQQWTDLWARCAGRMAPTTPAASANGGTKTAKSATGTRGGSRSAPKE
ncbi:hypothetical protein DLJ49_16310 [Rhodovulum sp. 12E13]|uniref:phasin family protein n=1 Tax=Rhodovulum sp. 12E13 TaxID=2203891 RepID=UPI000E116755|nr:phasin family protein [Rhodovulum sp. 12E13]RDC71090.1 hypothetical protein DLJ49_16310 [Rhodovulum sp. 12E13]